MRAAILPFILIFTSAFAQPAQGPQEAAAGQEFDLRAGETTRVDGLRVEFVGVTEDSRCPVDVTCVWQGNAKVMLQVKGRGMRSRTLRLNTGLDPRQQSYGGYDVRLVKLEPRKKKSERIRRREYVATLIVTRR